jgi:hypothetical protein
MFQSGTLERRIETWFSRWLDDAAQASAVAKDWQKEYRRT